MSPWGDASACLFGYLNLHPDVNLPTYLLLKVKKFQKNLTELKSKT